MTLHVAYDKQAGKWKAFRPKGMFADYAKTKGGAKDIARDRKEPWEDILVHKRNGNFQRRYNE